MSTVALATGISLGRLPTAALLEIESNGTLLSKFKGTSKQNDIYCWLNPFMGTCVIGLGIYAMKADHAMNRTKISSHFNLT